MCLITIKKECYHSFTILLILMYKQTYQRTYIYFNYVETFNRANLAYDLGALYEQEANQDKMHVYKNVS
jgi:hypothetical protein